MKTSCLLAIFLVFLLTPNFTLLSATRTFEATFQPKVGIYYYPWYRGNWSTYHKDCPDTPVLGQYDSFNSSVIIQHLNWFEELGIDFIVFSWWGKGSPSDISTGLVLDQIVKNYTDLQFFIMVENFENYTDIWEESYNATSGEFNYPLICEYLYLRYYVLFGSNCFYLDGKPTIGYYDGLGKNLVNKVPNDDRFAIRFIGPNSIDDWEYQVPNAGLSTQPVCRDGEVSVTPRYDANGWREDIDYSEGLYDKQWNKAINEVGQGRVHIVTIISWNEFAERTQIEPDWDTTSAFKEDPYYLFEKTKEYVQTIKTKSAGYFFIAAGLLVVFAIGLATIIVLKKKRHVDISTKGGFNSHLTGNEYMVLSHIC